MTMALMSRAARICMHLALIPLMLLVAAFVGWSAGDYHWPYAVQSVDIEPDPAYAGGSVGFTTVRNYFADCDLAYDRKLESVSDLKTPPVLLPRDEGPTPWAYNGKPHKIRIAIPADFPCGSAQIRTSPSASCNWLQWGPLRQHARDVLTPFDVACRSPS